MHELRDAVQARGLDDLDAHHRVVVEEAPGSARFAPMPPTVAARWNTTVGPRRVEHGADRRAVAKIGLRAARDDDRRAAGAAQQRPRRGCRGSRRRR
jgi:hypothetical protein